MTKYQYADVQGVRIFYRESGRADRPTILLLHGFPTSSHMFRSLMRDLSGHYHLIAPDLPGFGFSDAPDRQSYAYTFASLAQTIRQFTETLGLRRYVLYLFDYGAPVGWRLALEKPDRVSAIVSQNGNAYEEGLSDAWRPLQAYWGQPSKENREALRGLLSYESTRWQYLHGVPDPHSIAPETYSLDAALLARPGIDEIQLDLFSDYANNIRAYPGFQEYFRRHNPPLLAVWGKNDPFFLPAGAQAFTKDLPNAQVHLLDTGHFALETHHQEIAERMIVFLERLDL